MIASIVAAMTARFKILEEEKKEREKERKKAKRGTRRPVNRKKPLSIPNISKEVL